jgi:hypothetical protein
MLRPRPPTPASARGARPSRLPSPAVRAAGAFEGLSNLLSRARPPPPAQGPDALVDELLSLVVDTDAGAAASATTAAAVSATAARLSRFASPAPTRSPDMYGEWLVLFCSNPAAPGGPVLRSAAGRALAQRQVPRQTLTPPTPSAPGRLVNRVAFSVLGVLPPATAAEQGGPLEVTGPAAYRATLGDAVRDFEVVYVDSRVRVVEYCPPGRERQLFVFGRAGVERPRGAGAAPGAADAEALEALKAEVAEAAAAARAAAADAKAVAAAAAPALRATAGAVAAVDAADAEAERLAEAAAQAVAEVSAAAAALSKAEAALRAAA